MSSRSLEVTCWIYALPCVRRYGWVRDRPTTVNDTRVNSCSPSETFLPEFWSPKRERLPPTAAATWRERRWDNPTATNRSDGGTAFTIQHIAPHQLTSAGTVSVSSRPHAEERRSVQTRECLLSYFFTWQGNAWQKSFSQGLLFPRIATRCICACEASGLILSNVLDKRIDSKCATCVPTGLDRIQSRRCARGASDQYLVARAKCS